MKDYLLLFFLTLFLILCGGLPVLAQENGDLDLRPTVQSMGARTRAEITRVGDRGANVGRALSLQAEGDEALRRGELALAAEDCGRAREAISVLDRERSLALDERSRANIDLQRAERAGEDISWAADKVSAGNRAFDSGNYVTAGMEFAEARADLIGD